MHRKGWRMDEERVLIENYHTKTIYELEEMLDRNQDSINSKIKRLKAEGKLGGNKDENAVTRSLQQRRK